MTFEIDLLIPTPKNKNKNKHPLGDPPWSLLVVGPSRCGKSNVVLNIILKWYSKAFDEFYLASETAYRPSSGWLTLIQNDIIPESNVEDNFSKASEFLETIIERQKETDGKDHVLVVLDDLAKETKTSVMLEALFTRGRHLNISTILISQVFYNVHPSIRKNTSHMIIFRPTDSKELEALATELSGMQDKKEFKKMLLDVTKKLHDFLFVANNEPNLSMKYMKNFNQRITVDISELLV